MIKKPLGTQLDGIGCSEALDSSGERVILKGVDISSLASTGVFNWEHENKQSSQIVGKILEAKKIYTLEDCTNKRHKKFFEANHNKPYLYVRGVLFDSFGHIGASEIAAILRFDKHSEAENNERVINFSIDGGRLETTKDGVVKKCIARKVAITVAACNKVCFGELLEDSEKEVKEKGDISDILLTAFNKSEQEYEESLNKGELKSAATKQMIANRKEPGLKAQDRYVQGIGAAKMHSTNPPTPSNIMKPPGKVTSKPEHTPVISGKDFQAKIAAKRAEHQANKAKPANHNVLPMKPNNMRKSLIAASNPLQKEKLEKEMIKVMADNTLEFFNKKEELISYIAKTYEVDQNEAIAIAKTYTYAQEMKKEAKLSELLNDKKV